MKNLIYSLIFASAIISCQSDGMKYLNSVEQEAEQYMQDLKSAKTKEEVQTLRRDFVEKIDFINPYQTEDELGADLKENADMATIEKFQDLKRQIEQAEREAYSRVE